MCVTLCSEPQDRRFTNFHYYYYYYLRIIRGELDRLIGECGVKVLQVALRADERFVGRGDLLVLQLLPIDGAEKWVGLDVGKAGVWVAAQPLCWILSHRH